jgi:predicted AlkP superfamily pyrophosphatase or phosphodiesterase
MKRIGIFFLVISFTIISNAQPLARPKLVVGIVVDQMRWDYLYRYYERYLPQGGFKRMLSQGFSCENTLIPYAPTVTGCGHASVYTGSVPAINGITGNVWWDKELGRPVYCAEDKNAKTTGSSSVLGMMSPKNLLTTTICDELRLATNFRGKAIGIAIKDRGSILPAGHSANAAYWYDNTIGGWISSDYYMKDLPKWVVDFNSKKPVDNYYQQGWDLLYPASTYVNSTADQKTYEASPFGPAAKGFPYDLKSFIGKSYGVITSTPFGNSLTMEFAKTAIVSEQLGVDGITDFLALSFSSPDYIGHSFGPNSIEAEDGFLRLDKELGDLLVFLDQKVGKGKYTVFLTADHGVLQVPEFLQENKIPAGRVFQTKLTNQLNLELKTKFNIATTILSDENYQFHLNHKVLDSAKISKEDVTSWIIERLQYEPGIARVFGLDDLNRIPLPARIKEMISNGYYPRRNGDIQVILLPNYIDTWSTTGTTHGLWNPYDAHIPLLWYGWGIRQGRSNQEFHMTDIAATLAALLRIQEPSGSIGRPITELIKMQE